MKGNSGIPKVTDPMSTPNDRSNKKPPRSVNKSYISGKNSPSKNSSINDISVIDFKQEKLNIELQNEYGQIA